MLVTLLILLAAAGSGEVPSCREIAPVGSAKSGSSLEVTLDVLGDGGEEIIEIWTTEHLRDGDPGCTIHPGLRLKDATGTTVEEIALPVGHCGGVGLWSGSFWTLPGGGTLAALELGPSFIRHYTGDLYVLYLGREGGVKKLAGFEEISGLVSMQPDTWARATVGVRLFELEGDPVVAVESETVRVECNDADECSETRSRADRWFELAAGRTARTQRPVSRQQACATGSGRQP